MEIEPAEIKTAGSISTEGSFFTAGSISTSRLNLHIPDIKKRDTFSVWLLKFLKTFLPSLRKSILKNTYEGSFTGLNFHITDVEIEPDVLKETPPPVKINESILIDSYTIILLF